MASSSFKNNNGSLLFKQGRRHFLSIIRGDAIHLHNLEIPRQFVEFHGDDLPRVMILKVPTGATWPVEIVRRKNGQIWFQNGWREFAKYYSLVEGSSIVFEYEKSRSSSQFNVIIYDKTMNEIDYNDEEHSDSSVEILSSKLNLDGQAQGRQRVNQSFGRKKAFTAEEKAKAVYVHSEAEQRVNKSTFARKKAEKAKAPVHCEGRKRSSITRRNKKLYKAEKSKAIERAKSNFRSENPSFQMVLQPSYVDQKSTVSPVIPTKFAKKFLRKKNCDATLTLLDGRRSWPIKLYRPAISAKATTRIIVTGWRRFVKDNDLEVGDVCMFERFLKYGNKTEFRVTIYKYSNLSRLPGNCKQSKEKASCSKSKRSSDRQKRQRANLDEPEMVDEVEDDVSVEIWDQYLSRSRKRKAKSPISLPSRPNKKIKSESTSAKKRPSGQAEGSTKQPKEKGSSSKGLPKLSFSPRPEARKLSSTMSQSLSNRTFQITMSQSYVHPCKSNLPIPVEFSRIHMKRENGDALFKVLGGRTWTVKYYNTSSSGQTRTWVRNSSWKEFARENQLKVGDICKFELIDPHKTLFKVVICRTTPCANAPVSHNW